MREGGARETQGRGVGVGGSGNRESERESERERERERRMAGTVRALKEAQHTPAVAIGITGLRKVHIQ